MKLFVFIARCIAFEVACFVPADAVTDETGAVRGADEDEKVFMMLPHLLKTTLHKNCIIFFVLQPSHCAQQGFAHGEENLRTEPEKYRNEYYSYRVNNYSFSNRRNSDCLPRARLGRTEQGIDCRGVPESVRNRHRRGCAIPYSPRECLDLETVLVDSRKFDFP